MPLWQIYHPETAFSDADKQAIAEGATQLYQSFLPRFYVNVFFHPLPKSSFFIGGEAVDDFVRVSIDHIAQSMADAAMQERFITACGRVLAPFVADRGLRWELHIDETPFALWTIGGLKPPVPGTPEGERWRQANRPLPNAD